MQPRVEVETWERQYESPGSSGWSTPVEGGRETPSPLLHWAIQVRREVWPFDGHFSH